MERGGVCYICLMTEIQSIKVYYNIRFRKTKYQITTLTKSLIMNIKGKTPLSVSALVDYHPPPTTTILPRTNNVVFRERVINSTRGTLEEISLQGLLPGTTYTVRVLAHNQQGPGVSSQPASITTQSEVELPGPPANISARPTSAFSILVRWDGPASPVKKYKLYHRRVSSR